MKKFILGAALAAFSMGAIGTASAATSVLNQVSPQQQELIERLCMEGHERLCTGVHGVTVYSVIDGDFTDLGKVKDFQGKSRDQVKDMVKEKVIEKVVGDTEAELEEARAEVRDQIVMATLEGTGLDTLEELRVEYNNIQSSLTFVQHVHQRLVNEDYLVEQEDGTFQNEFITDDNLIRLATSEGVGNRADTLINGGRHDDTGGIAYRDNIDNPRVVRFLNGDFSHPNDRDLEARITQVLENAIPQAYEDGYNDGYADGYRDGFNDAIVGIQNN